MKASKELDRMTDIKALDHHCMLLYETQAIDLAIVVVEVEPVVEEKQEEEERQIEINIVIDEFKKNVIRKQEKEK